MRSSGPARDGQGKGEIKSLGKIELSFHKLQKDYLDADRKIVL